MIWPEDVIWQINKVIFINVLQEQRNIWGHICISKWDLQKERISYLVNNTKSYKTILEVVHAFRNQTVWLFSSKSFAALFLHNTSLLRNRATHEPNGGTLKCSFGFKRVLRYAMVFILLVNAFCSIKNVK